MSILGRVLASVSGPYSMEDFDREVLSRVRGLGSHAGVDVNENTAMRLIDVYSCVRVISETLGSLPGAVYRKRQGGSGADKVDDHPVSRLLWHEANPDTSGQALVEAVTANCAISGNGEAIITWNYRGQPARLDPYQWTQVTPQRNRDTGRVEYRVTVDGVSEVYPAERVLHLPGYGFDGMVGLSPIRYAAEMVGIGLATQEFLARFYGQGMNVGGVLEHPKALSEEARTNLKQDIMERGAGLANSWMPLILEEGMKFSRIPMHLKDAQTVEMLKLTRDQIAALFRIPPHMIANMERATFSNVEHLSLEFVKYSMLPWIRRWEQEVNRKLFTTREKEQGFYAKFNVEGLLRGDYKSRQEGLQIMRQSGVISTNDWRALEEFNPRSDPGADALLVNGNMVPLETALKAGPVGRQPAEE